MKCNAYVDEQKACMLDNTQCEHPQHPCKITFPDTSEFTGVKRK